MRLARFACDVTPPLGHPLCGGWIDPVKSIDDPLEARGVVLLDAGRPIVLCAVDWCELRNDSHERWRHALAEAAGTDPERVAVQCLHQHDAPMADIGAERLLDMTLGTTSCVDPEFHEQATTRTAAALKAALADAVAFDHIGTGRAKVDQVASSRRILGPDGRVALVRYSAMKAGPAKTAPEGLIDPYLNTLSFWHGDKPLAALHYYATHPMSHYGKGRVSSDFAGLARRQRQADQPEVFQVYFTGCAGNITAGKYNEGTDADRITLRDRIHAGMLAAWQATRREAVSKLSWKVEPVRLAPRTEPQFGVVASASTLADPTQSAVKRNNAAIQLAWLARLERPIDLTCLRIGSAAVVHLPGEPFIEYQLEAQKLAPDQFVCVAGYGDGGPGYIPTAKAFEEGGYEPTVALAAPESEETLNKALAKLLRSGT